MVRTPSSTRFVVRGVAGPHVPAGLRAKAVRALPGTPSGLVVEAGAEGADARATWQELVRALGPGAFVAPVLLDDRGHELYPTGRVQVRFRDEPSDADLRHLARRHGLGDAVRNRYQPLQAAFPVEGGYLPDVVAALSGEHAVRRAWEDVEAAFERQD